MGSGPNPGNLFAFPKITGIILLLISIWNYPAYKNQPPQISGLLSLPCVTAHTLVCGACFSLNLDKSTSYLSLCLSLNSFCDKISRTWASLGPKTRYCGFGWVWVPATWVQLPICGKLFQLDWSVCLVTQSCLTLCDPMDCSPTALLSVTIFRQEYGVGCHFLLQAIFPTQGSNQFPGSPASQVNSLPIEPSGKWIILKFMLWDHDDE